MQDGEDQRGLSRAMDAKYVVASGGLYAQAREQITPVLENALTRGEGSRNSVDLPSVEPCLGNTPLAGGVADDLAQFSFRLTGIDVSAGV